MSYQYPLDYDWNKAEIIEVMNFYSCVEKAYESTINAEEILSAYAKFKKIVPGKSEEKRFFQEFSDSSGYVPYKVVKEAKEKKIGKVKITK